MAKGYPKELLDVLEGTQRNKADGRVRGSSLRVDRSTINTTTQPKTTSDTLSLGYAKAGQRTRAFEINSNGVNMSTASIAIGTAGDPDKYLAAAALPNATSARRHVVQSAAGFEPIEAEEEIIVTISGASIPNGFLTIDREYTQR